MIDVLFFLAVVATGDPASAAPMESRAESPLAIQVARVNNWGRNYRVGKNGVVTPTKSFNPKPGKGSKKAKGGYKAPKAAKKTKVKLPKNNAPPQSFYNSNLVDQTLGPMR